MLYVFVAQTDLTLAVISEVVCGELVVPVGLVVGGVHGQGLVVDALVGPLATLVKHEHLLRHMVSIDHVQINTLVLLEENSP